MLDEITNEDKQHVRNCVKGWEMEMIMRAGKSVRMGKFPFKKGITMGHDPPSGSKDIVLAIPPILTNPS